VIIDTTTLEVSTGPILDRFNVDLLTLRLILES